MLSADEGIRRGGTMESLGALQPVWESEDQPAPEITAGNASQMSDGASAMLIADRATAERMGLPIRARFVHFAVAADDPVLVLSAPNPVTRKLLERTGMKIDEFDAMECNEAFAAIALMWAKEFQPDPAKLNPRGGAIAIGHPLGASGVRLDDDDAQPPRGDGGPIRVPDHVRGRWPGERDGHRATRLSG